MNGNPKAASTQEALHFISTSPTSQTPQNTNDCSWRSCAERRALLLRMTGFLEAAKVVGSSGCFTGANEVSRGFLRIERLVEGHGFAADGQH